MSFSIWQLPAAILFDPKAFADHLMHNPPEMAFRAGLEISEAMSQVAFDLPATIRLGKILEGFQGKNERLYNPSSSYWQKKTARTVLNMGTKGKWANFVGQVLEEIDPASHRTEEGALALFGGDSERIEPEIPDVADYQDSALLRAELKNLWESFSKKEIALVGWLRLGLPFNDRGIGSAEGLTLRTIGEILHLSHMEIRRLETRFFRMARHPSRSKTFREFIRPGMEAEPIFYQPIPETREQRTVREEIRGFLDNHRHDKRLGELGQLLLMIGVSTETALMTLEYFVRYPQTSLREIFISLSEKNGEIAYLQVLQKRLRPVSPQKSRLMEIMRNYPKPLGLFLEEVGKSGMEGTFLPYYLERRWPLDARLYHAIKEEWADSSNREKTVREFETDLRLAEEGKFNLISPFRPLDVALARYTLCRNFLSPPTSAEEASLARLEDWIAELREQSVGRYILDPRGIMGEMKAFAKNFRKKFLALLPLERLDFDDVLALYKIYRKKRLSTDAVHAMATHPDGLKIYRSAEKTGLDSREALEHIFRAANPHDAFHNLETALRQFTEKPPLIERSTEHSEAEWIAIHQLAERHFFKSPLDGRLFPSFTRFRKLLGIRKDVLLDGEIVEILEGNPAKPHWLPEWLDTSKLNVPGINPLETLSLLKSKQKWRSFLGRGKLRSVYEILLRATLDTHRCFYHCIEWLVKKESQIEAAICLAEAGCERVDIAETLLEQNDSLKAVRNYQSAKRQYVRNPVFQVVREDSPLSPHQEAALYQIFYATGYRWPNNFRDFRVYLKWLWLYCQMSKTTLSLQELFEHIADTEPKHQEALENPNDASLLVQTLSNMAEGKFPYMGKTLFVQITEAFLKSSRVGRIFFAKTVFRTVGPKVLNDLLLLLEAGQDLSLPLLGRFREAPDRAQRVKKISQRAQELVFGAEVVNFLDPFEWMAIQEVLKPFGLGFAKIERIFREWRKGTWPLGSFPPATHKFRVNLQVAVRAAVNTGLVEKYIKPIREAPTFEKLVEWLREILKYMKPTGLNIIRKDIAQFLKIRAEEDFARHTEKITEDTALSFLHFLLKTLSQNWNRARGLEIVERLLILSAWFEKTTEPMHEVVLGFDADGTAQEVLGAIAAVHDFYADHLQETVQRTFGSEFVLPRVFWRNAAERLEKEIVKVEHENLGSAEIILIPSRNFLDAFFGYFAENCLAKPEYAIHSFLDEKFIPYRILADGEWKGTIMSFTRMVGGKKVLILTGIDPQKNLHINPSDFMDHLEKAANRMAQEGDYDLVLIPANPVAQSSRRALLQPEIRRRYRQSFTLRQPIGFPKKSLGVISSAYYAMHRDFLIIIDNREDTPTPPEPAGTSRRW